MKSLILLLSIQNLCFATDNFNDYIFEEIPSKLGIFYKYEKKIMDAYDKEMKKWLEYSQKNPTFNLKPLTEALIYNAEKQKDNYLEDVDKTPYILYPIKLCKILWDEGNIRSSNVLLASLSYPNSDSHTKEKFGSRIGIILQEIKEESIENLSLDAQTLILADLIYKTRNLENRSTKKNIEFLKSSSEKLVKIHGANLLLEKILLEELSKNPKSILSSSIS